MTRLLNNDLTVPILHLGFFSDQVSFSMEECKTMLPYVEGMGRVEKQGTVKPAHNRQIRSQGKLTVRSR